MEQEVDKICSKLAELDSEELGKVIKTAEWLQDKSLAGQKSKIDKDRRMFFAALVDALDSRNIPLPPKQSLRMWPPRVKGLKEAEFEAAYEAVRSLRTGALKILPARYTYAIYRLICVMAVLWLQEKASTSLAKEMQRVFEQIRAENKDKPIKGLDRLEEKLDAELRRRGIVSIPRVLEALKNVNAVLDYSLPGYLRSKTLAWVFRAMVEGNAAEDYTFSG